MRMRKKKNTELRLSKCSELLLPKEIINCEKETVLEIGCGKGSFICEMAKREPDVLFIAMEKVPDVAMLAAENAKNRPLFWGRTMNITAAPKHRSSPPTMPDSHRAKNDANSRPDRYPSPKIAAFRVIAYPSPIIFTLTGILYHIIRKNVKAGRIALRIFNRHYFQNVNKNAIYVHNRSILRRQAVFRQAEISQKISKNA